MSIDALEDFLKRSIDGSWIDIVSIISGFFFAVYKKHQLKALNKTTVRFTILWANGLAIFPLSMLMFGCVDSKLIQAVFETGKSVLFIAGLFAIESIFKAD